MKYITGQALIVGALAGLISGTVALLTDTGFTVGILLFALGAVFQERIAGPLRRWAFLKKAEKEGQGDG